MLIDRVVVAQQRALLLDILQRSRLIEPGRGSEGKAQMFIADSLSLAKPSYFDHIWQ